MTHDSVLNPSWLEGGGGGGGGGGAAGAISGAILGTAIGNLISNNPYLQAKKSKKSEKEKASDVPSWAEGEKPLPGESGKDFAKRLLDKKYGKDGYPTGPGSEYNKIKKSGDRCQ